MVRNVVEKQYLVKGNLPKPIRRCSLKHSDQFCHPIEVNPFTNLLQIFENRFECQNPKTHSRGSEASHPNIGAHINNKPIKSFAFDPLQNLLNRYRNIGFPKQFPFEDSDDVLVRLVGQISEIGKRVQKRVSNAFNGASNHWVCLWRFDAIERRNRVEREMSVDGEEARTGAGGPRSEGKEDKEKDKRNREK